MSKVSYIKSQKGREVKNYLTNGAKATVLKAIKKQAKKARRFYTKQFLKEGIL
jgi:hypothetical protein